MKTRLRQHRRGGTETSFLWRFHLLGFSSRTGAAIRDPSAKLYGALLRAVTWSGFARFQRRPDCKGLLEMTIQGRVARMRDYSVIQKNDTGDRSARLTIILLAAALCSLLCSAPAGASEVRAFWLLRT